MTRDLACSIFLTLAAAGGAVAQQVRLPLDAYEALRHRAEAPPPVPPTPPLDLAVQDVRVSVKVGTETALVHQQLEVAVLADGWQGLELRIPGALAAVDLGGLEGFVGGPSGSTLFLRGEGRHRVRLDSVLAIDRDAEAARPTWRLRLDLSAGVRRTGVLETPPEVEEVTSQEALLRREGSGWSWVASPSGTVTLLLQGPAPAPGTRALRYEATSATALRVSRTAVEAQVWIDGEVLGGRLRRLSIPLPRGWKVVALDSTPQVGWKVDEELLELALQTPTESHFAVHLRLAAGPRSVVDTPLLAPLDAARCRLFGRTSVDGDGLLTMTESGSATPAGPLPADLPAAFLTAPGRPMRIAAAERPPRWEVTWSQGGEVLGAEVQRLLVDVVAGLEDRAFYQLWLEVRNAGAPQLVLTPPTGFRPLRAARQGLALTPGAAPDSLLLPLAAAGDIQVLYLAGLMPLAVPRDGVWSLPLPSFSAPVRRVEVRAVLPPGRRYSLADPTRSAAVRPPPTVATTTFKTDLGRRLAAPLGDAAHRRVEASIPPPPGFVIVEAAWDALAPSLEPLRLAVHPERTPQEWF